MARSRRFLRGRRPGATSRADHASPSCRDGHDLHVEAVPAVARSLTWLRQTLTEWARGTPLHPEQIVELRTAAYEALANAVEHAYQHDRTGVLDLRAACSASTDTVTVTVTDHGRWLPTVVDDRSPRGHGLRLINGLADEVDISTSPAGTTVRMAWTPHATGAA